MSKINTIARILSGNAPLIENLERRELFATFVVTNTLDSGAGSLRDAISAANRTSASDTIQFKIGSGAKTIQPTKALPYISYPIVIDGSTQPGYSGKPIIEIRGDKAGGATGLSVGGGSSTIKGLVINRFSGMGIMIVKGGSNTVKNCYIGTDITGSYAAGNGDKGIFLQTANNQIGGGAAGERNVISGNGSLGVQMWTYSAQYNRIQGNYIGTDAAGNKAIANGASGIGINGAYHNQIGGSAWGAGNVISGNKQDGLVINGSGATDTVVEGNIIGLNARGDTRLGNGWYGIETSQARTRIGGTGPTDRNIVSGNNYSGIVLWLNSGSNNKVIGNLVGTDITGTRDIGNYWRGIDISNGSSNNVIGGASVAERNIISGNDLNGILVYQGTNNRIENNYVGFDRTGTQAIGNYGNGFQIVQTSGVTIKSNRIGNNSGYGIFSASSYNITASGNTLVNDGLFGLKSA